MLPIPDRYAAQGRNYEYKREGIVSLFAGIDLHPGQSIRWSMTVMAVVSLSNFSLCWTEAIRWAEGFGTDRGEEM